MDQRATQGFRTKIVVVHSESLVQASGILIEKTLCLGATFLDAEVSSP